MSVLVHRIGATLDYSIDLAAEGYLETTASPAEEIAASPVPAWTQAPSNSPSLVTLANASFTTTVLTVQVTANAGVAGDIVELTCTFQTSTRAIDHEVKLTLQLED